jgi:hypothetical protein
LIRREEKLLRFSVRGGTETALRPSADRPVENFCEFREGGACATQRVSPTGQAVAGRNLRGLKVDPFPFLSHSRSCYGDSPVCARRGQSCRTTFSREL